MEILLFDITGKMQSHHCFLHAMSFWLPDSINSKHNLVCITITIKLICGWLELCTLWISLLQGWVIGWMKLKLTLALNFILLFNKLLWEIPSPQLCLLCSVSANALRVYRSFSCWKWDGATERGEIKALSTFAGCDTKTVCGEVLNKHSTQSRGSAEVG